MGTAELVEIFTDAIITGLKVMGPVLLLSIIVGLIISILQAATSVNEQTLTFVPKLIVIGIAFILFGSWMLQQLVDFTYRLFEFIVTYV